ncbi:MAG TPA: zinc ribbon domain-containing protein, partial [Longimicrobium sp.]|nr:zinc ribbon domain-containing protein [Longimicrobium sp.]
MSTSCPSCGIASAGRFCPDCGVALNATCRECQNPLPFGARFCNDCGVAVATPAVARSRKAMVPWALAGVSVAALAAVLLFRPGNEPAAQPAAPPAGPFAQSGAPVGDARSVDLSSMTPREAADRLFNRVLSAEASGDTAQARQFAPMAVQAYGQVPQDNDVRYHLSELFRVQGDAASVKAQADAILAADPKHLFGL